MRQQCIKIFIERLTNLSEKDEPKPMIPFLISLFLHDLSMYFSANELTDDMIPFLEQIILISFSHIRSEFWNIKNAALTLFGALTPKIMKQRARFDNPDDEWQHVQIHFDEFIALLPRVSDHILEELETWECQATESVVLYLEFLSNIEVRHKSPGQTVIRYREKLWQLLGHRHDKVRRLAAICFAHFHQYSEEVPTAIIATIPVLFTSDDENFKHGLILAVTNLLRKLRSQYQFIEWPTKNEFYTTVQETFNTTYRHDTTAITYYTRTYLLTLLLTFRFSVKHDIVRWAIFEKPAKNYIGYDIWMQQVTELLASEFEIGTRIDREFSLDDMSVSVSEMN